VTEEDWMAGMIREDEETGWGGAGVDEDKLK